MTRGWFPHLTRGRKGIASALTFALTAATVAIGVVVAPPAQAAGPSIDLAATGSSSILLGAPVDYTLTSTNPSSNPDAEPVYNTTFRVVLPVGVTYQAGTTTPTSYGNPTTFTDAFGAQTLVWSNVADLQVDSAVALSFKATPSTESYPVASSFTATADAFASTDPRLIPKFDSNGLAIVAGNVVPDTGRTVTTQVSAIRVTKSEPSAEGELLRGVHNHTTVYTVRVVNNGLNPTENVVLTDYLPADLEYLACGNEDNTPGGAVEYPTAPGLDSTPPVITDCVTPDLVETVSNPPANGSQTYPAGVYTKLTWNVGTLPATQVATFKYAAGIPLLTNTMTFPGGTPSAASGAQGANLDNNLGAPTRETASESSATNHARAAGTYTGPVFGAGSPEVETTTSESVSVEDVHLLKTASTTTFTTDGIVTYTLRVRVSEYTDASDIVITDVIDNGLCPLSSATNYVTGAPADCAPTAGTDPTGATYTSVTQNPDGTFTSVFSPLVVAADGTATITYKARMRGTYTGGALAGLPTVAGDSFSNRATLTATTVPVPATGQGSVPQSVTDASSATLGTDGLSIDKTIMPRTLGADCSSGPYVESDDPAYTAADFTFRKGTRVCFQLEVDFPGTTSTKNAVVTDVVPAGTSYEAGSMTVVTAPGAGVAFNEAAAAAGTANPTWDLGDVAGSGLFVPPAQTLLVRFSVIVDAASTTGTVDITGNLMKFRSASTPGAATSLRDQVDFGIAPPPPVTVLKGVYQVNGAPALGNDPNVDGVQVSEGDVATFRVDVTNGGDAATGTDFSINGVNVWDVLAPGITCSMVSSISQVSTDPTSPAGTCTDPSDAGHPSFNGSTTLSAITWVFRSGTAGDPERIPAGTSRMLTYDVTVPAATSVGTVFTDTAYIRSFNAFTDLTGVTATYYPADNVDTTVPLDQQDALAASDPSNVYLPSVTGSKAVVSSSITETNNNGTNQVTNGETVTFRLSVVVPARTTVYNGALTDTLPTGFTAVSATAGYSAANTSPALDPLPVGSTFNATTGALSLPATFDNTSSSPALFEVLLTARATPSASTGTRNNTMTFTSTTKLAGGTAVTPLVRTASITVVQLSPTLTKANNSGATAVAGQSVLYTLTAGNANGRPPAHDTVVVDCVPSGLTFGTWGVPTQGSVDAPVAGDGTNGCAATFTKLVWNLGTIAPNVTRTVTYTATVNPAAAGSVVYTNTATITASSLNNGVNDAALERVSNVTRTSNVTVQGASLTKTVADPTRTIGQLATYTLTVPLPANVNFYDAAILDTLPGGLDPATVTVTSSSCTYPDTSSCTITPTRLSDAPGTGGATLIAWGAGDVLSDPLVRTVRIVFTAQVRDTGSNVAERSVLNSARVMWNIVNGDDPTSAGATWTRPGTAATASFIVVEPAVTPTKTVSDTTVEPGQVVTYTVTATNSSASNTSDAHNIVVTDAIPTGVVVNAATITGGGALTGAGVNGGGVITWTVTGPVNPGAALTYTYQASLAPSGTLTSAALTNTFRVNAYESLPSGGRAYTGTTAPRTVTPQFPALTTAKTTPAGTVAYVGQALPFRITTSIASAQATDVAITDTLPANWTYVTGSAQVTDAAAVTTQIEPAVSVAGNVTTLTWSGLGSADPGQSVIVNYEAFPTAAALTTPGVGASVAHTNTARASAKDATGATGNLTGPYQSNTATATARIHSADLSVAKTHTGSPAAGQSFSWKVRVTNLGPDTAVGAFTVTDTLPTGVTLSSATGDGWSCTTADPIVCQRTAPGDTLASGASFADITVTVATPASAADGATFTNNVTVTARTYDPVVPNNSTADTVTLTNQADLAIVKLFTAPVVAGQGTSWSLTVSNNGVSDADGTIVVTDTLPTGVVPQSATGTGWTCDITGQDVTCEHPAGLAASDTAGIITLVAAVDPSFTGTLSNTATVTGPTADPNPGNNTSTATASTGTSADLAIAKVHTGDMTAGTSDSYTLTVTNLGPSDAQNVVVTDTLPAGLTATGAAGPGWTCTVTGGDQVECTRATLASGATRTVTIDVDIDPGVTGEVVNTARVTSDTFDPVPANNESTDTTTSNARADLAVTKSHSGTAVAGQPLTFTLEVTNLGPSNSPTVTVIDTIPAGMSATNAAGPGWSCDITGQTVTCVRAGGPARGASSSITLDVDLAPDAGPATLTNEATVTGPLADPVLGNNKATDDVSVLDRANVSIEKAVTGADPVKAGQGTSFRLTVHNDGPSDADDVTVIDTLPTGMTAGDVTTSGWSCSSSGQVITCERATLAAGASDTIDIDVTVDSSVLDAATLTNESTVSTSTTGDVLTDNDARASVTVTTEADLSIVKSADPVMADSRGQQVTWTLAVRNNGPSDVTGTTTITDTLPAGLVLLGADGGWTCSNVDQDLTCTLPGPFQANTDAPVVTLRTMIDAGAPAGALPNTARVSSPTTDPNPGNDTSTDTVTVTQNADVAVTKTHTGNGLVGQDTAFTIVVTNNGPSNAVGVRIEDTLPAGLTYVSAAALGTDPIGACATAPGVEGATTITCPLTADMAPGSSVTLLVTATVDAGAYPSVTNTVDVTSSTPDPDLGNNRATDPVAVDPLADLTLVKTHLGDGPFVVGDQASYLLTVANSGPTRDEGPLTVTDTLPTGLAFVSAAGDGWTCSSVGQAVTCRSLSGLGVGESTVITVVVDVEPAAYASVTNSATVTGTGTDPVLGNNTGTDTTRVLPLVDLALVKTGSVPDPQGRIAWTLVVTNNGPNDAPGPIIVSDPLIAELRFVSASGAGWTCQAVSQMVTCERAADLAVGASAPAITLVTDVVPGTPVGTALTNTAQVELPGGVLVDRVPGNNTSQASVSMPGETDPGLGEHPQTGANVTLLLLLTMLFTGSGLLLLRLGRQR